MSIHIARMRTPKSYIDRILYGYVKKVGNRWAVFGWNENTETVGTVEYTNIDAETACKSEGHSSVCEGPCIITWWDCRIDKSIDSVIH